MTEPDERSAHPRDDEVHATVRIDGEEVRYRRFRPGDEEQLVEVHRAGFGGFFPAWKPVDEHEFLRWFTEPHQSHYGEITVGEIGSRLGGTAGRLLREIKVGDRVLFGQAGGIGGATHPDFQRRGLYQGLHEWRDASEDPPITASLIRRQRDPRRPKHERTPFHGKMGVYLRVLRPWDAAVEHRGFTPLGALAYAGPALWGRLRSARSRTAGGVVLGTLPAFDGRLEPFWERASSAWDLIPMRSIEFLNWRFCDPRAGKFTVRAAEADGELAGYSVTHTVGARGHIMDLLALPGRLDVVRTLVDDTVRQLGEAGAAAVECWMLREHPYAQVLRQTGFLRLHRPSAYEVSRIGLTGFGINPDERALLASPEAKVHLVRADFDGI